jgi:hypothetical protein
VTIKIFLNISSLFSFLVCISRSPKNTKEKPSRSRKQSQSPSDSSDSDGKLVMNKDLLEKLEKERQRVLADKKKWKEQVF